MLCENCGKHEANVKYTQIINGVKKEMLLCEECAKERGINNIDFNMPINFSSFLSDIFDELNYDNKLIFFADGILALEYLTKTDIEPFLIISDINMPKLNGLELREKIHNNEDLRLKSIPYLFFSTSAEQKHVIDAYSRSIQGFFVKPTSYEKIKKVIVKIVEYWQECESPNYIKNAQQ